METPVPPNIVPGDASDGAQTHPSNETDFQEELATPVGRQFSFPIIGIGTSAGGLDALELFLKNVPPASGMAFVIVQHLDPTHKGMLVELLQRATAMPVHQIVDQLEIRANAVYVIPPNKDLSILHGVLFLFPPLAPRGLRLPIDFFLRALADDQQERSVGVILSGMGSDGTLGLRAIKEKGGAVFVQDPDTAQFDSMPHSAVNDGLVDVVAKVEELPGKIAAFLKNIRALGRSDLPLESKTKSSLEKILILLRTQTGNDFSLYKKNTVYRRVERRMGLHQIDRISNYVRLLQENHQETELLFKELLIGVTSFFRDPSAWEKLKKEVLPSLLDAYPQGGTLRAWTAGCSTGEEAFSLAIIFKEAVALAKKKTNISLQIFATDLDPAAIEKARQGFYPANIVADVSAERLNRFFVQEENGFRIKKEIREMVVFAPHSLVRDAPFTRLDLLICRNLLIYLEAELQKKLLPLFHYCLNPNGVLFLGSAETIGGHSDLFSALDAKLRLYKRIAGSHPKTPIDFPTTFSKASTVKEDPMPHTDTPPQPPPNLAVLMDQLILKRYAPASVLTTNQGDILYINGRTGNYLEPAAGKANLNIFAMARDGLLFELNAAFQKSLREKTPVSVENLQFELNGKTQAVDLTIQPLTETEGLPAMVLVVFRDLPVHITGNKKRRIAKLPTSDPYVKQLEQDVLRMQTEIQVINEQMQTSKEELKSTNEEMQSTNEEMQSTNEELHSTNEELMTSKEEMQSLNEELQTVNHELQARVEDLSHSNNDMKNLLDSTNIATLFLDDTLHVRRFTNQTSKIIRLLPGDAGRPITDITSDLLYPELVEDSREVLRTLVFRERAVTTQDGGWFTVRIMPYRTMDNRIDGVVITFADISTAKKLESSMRKNEEEMQALLDFLPNPMGLFETIWDGTNKLSDCRILHLNTAFAQIFGMNKTTPAVDRKLSDLWRGINRAVYAVCEQVAIDGKSADLPMDNLLIEKDLICTVSRPGESRTRICMILKTAK